MRRAGRPAAAARRSSRSIVAQEGSRTTTGSSPASSGRPQRAPQHALGHVQLARGVPRQAAAHGAPGEDDLEAGCLQHPHRGVGDIRRQVVVEGVRPEHDAAVRACRGGVGRERRQLPLALPGEGAAGQRRDAPLGGDASRPREDPPRQARAGDAVDEPRDAEARRQAQPERQPAQRVVRERPQPAPVVVVQELRLVGGHVHARWGTARRSRGRPGRGRAPRAPRCEPQPSSARLPAIISWSSRARPRVECCSSRVARKLGHMSSEPWVETQRPTPMQRSTADRKSPPSWL